MRIKCQTEALHDAFQVVGSVVQQRPTRPILSSVLLSASPDGAQLQATDLEIAIRFEVQGVEVEEPGQVAVPQGRVTSILRETADETVLLWTEDGHCIISASDSEFRLPVEAADEFPEIPVFDEAKCYELDRREFGDMVVKTSFAAHKGKHRYALNGVLLVIEPDKVRMVATDGRRLAHIERKGKNPGATDESVIVPTKALEQIIRVLVDEDEKIRVNIRENQLVAKTVRATVSTRLVEGHFPPYESVVPKDCDKKVALDRERLHSAVRRAALLTSDESSSILLHFGAKKVRVTSAAPETGEAKVEFPIAYEGGEFEIGFNPHFLTEFLRVLEEDTIRAEFRDPSTAGLFRAGKDFIYVVMPVSRE